MHMQVACHVSIARAPPCWGATTAAPLTNTAVLRSRIRYGITAVLVAFCAAVVMFAVQYLAISISPWREESVSTTMIR